jgi:PUA domain protein
MRFLSGKEKKELNEKLPKGYIIEKKDDIKEKDNMLYKNEAKFLIIKDKNFLPHLKSINEKEYKSIYVDKGAIPFVIKGADIMRPGIRKIDENIQKNEIILVKDDTHFKTLAIGFAEYNSVDMQKQEKGKSVIIYHYVGDLYY